MEKSIFPAGYHVGAPLANTSRYSLFRPSQPTGLIFPGISLVFYSPYWFKHILHTCRDYKVLNRDCKREEQLAYFFVPISQDIVEHEESYDAARKNLLKRARNGVFYALLNIGPDLIENTFRDWPRNPNKWLFDKGDWVMDLSAKISNWTMHPNVNRIPDDLVQVLGAGLTTKLRKKGIDIRKEIEQSYIAKIKDNLTERDLVTAELAVFIWSLVREADYFKYNPLGPTNIHFVDQILHPAGQNFHPDLRYFANKDFFGEYGFSLDEKEAFLRSLETNLSGKTFLQSIILTDALLSIRHNRIDGEEYHRDAYKIIRKNESDTYSFIEKHYPFLNTSPEVLFEEVLMRSLAWEWNLFLLDGEHIIKDVLFDQLKEEGVHRDTIIKALDVDEEQSFSEISKLYASNSKALSHAYYCNLFSNFIVSLNEIDEKAEELKALYEYHKKDLKDKVRVFLKKTIDFIEMKKSANEIFLAFLHENSFINYADERFRLSENIEVATPFLPGFNQFKGLFNAFRCGDDNE